jgi:hypothetical protein
MASHLVVSRVVLSSVELVIYFAGRQLSYNEVA